MESKNRNIGVWFIQTTCLICIAAITGCNNGANYNSRTADSIDSIADASIDSIVVDADQKMAHINSYAAGDQGSSATVPRALSTIKVDKASFSRLLKNTRKVHDEFQETYFYYDPTTVKYNNYNSVHCYINKDESGVNIRFKVQYNADDWLFIEKATFNIDGQNIIYIPTEVPRDNGDGEIWEWFDESVGDTELEILTKLASAKTAKVKFDGSQYYAVKTISKKQRTAINNQLALYKGFLLGYDK